jgi:hypothetical protein
MSNAEPTIDPTTSPEPVKPPASRVFLVRVPRPDGPPFVSDPARAESPEAAAEEVLLSLFGATRPALAPERVEVIEVAPGCVVPWPLGPAVTLAVDEWSEARVFMVPDPAAPADLERLRAERAIFHLERAEASLEALREALEEPEDAARIGVAATVFGLAAASVRPILARRGRP